MRFYSRSGCASALLLGLRRAGAAPLLCALGASVMLQALGAAREAFLSAVANAAAALATILAWAAPRTC